MRCDIANAPAGSLLAFAGEYLQAAAGCRMVKQAAAFLGISSGEIAAICGSAKTVTGFDHRRRVRYIKYSSAERCPLLAVVIETAAACPVPGEIVANGVYTVGMAAAALDMSRAAVRRLVKSGRLVGFADRGGYLICGAELLRFVAGASVLGAGRRGVIRPGGRGCVNM